MDYLTPTIVDGICIRHNRSTFIVVLNSVRFVVTAKKHVVNIDVVLDVMGYRLIVILSVTSKSGVQQKGRASGAEEDGLEAVLMVFRDSSGLKAKGIW